MIGFYNYTVWLTYLGMISGISGLWLAATGKPLFAVLCLLFSGFCDLFDGKATSGTVASVYKSIEKKLTNVLNKQFLKQYQAMIEDEQ